MLMQFKSDELPSFVEKFEIKDEVGKEIGGGRCFLNVGVQFKLSEARTVYNWRMRIYPDISRLAEGFNEEDLYIDFSKTKFPKLGKVFLKDFPQLLERRSSSVYMCLQRI